MKANRTYGGCSACCEILGVPALKKQEWQQCEHQCETGCVIYSGRPNDCRMLECGWLVGHLDEDDRPDKLGLIFTLAEHGEAPGEG